MTRVTQGVEIYLLKYLKEQLLSVGSQGPSTVTGGIGNKVAGRNGVQRQEGELVCSPGGPPRSRTAGVDGVNREVARVSVTSLLWGPWPHTR